MFRAVRSLFGGESKSFRRLRFERAVRLFAFEFVVVLLGVLAAQMLQERFTDARERGAAKSAMDRARSETSGFRSTADYWRSAAPCLDRNMDALMRSVAASKTIDPALTARPRMPLTALTPWGEDTIGAARQVYGDSVVSAFFALQTMAAKMSRDSDDLAGEWALLSLVDPSLGPISSEDRINARVAAGRIKGRLESLEVSAENAERISDSLGIAADPVRRRVLTLPQGCSELRR